MSGSLRLARSWHIESTHKHCIRTDNSMCACKPKKKESGLKKCVATTQRVACSTLRLILSEEQGPGNRHCSLRALQGLPWTRARMHLIRGKPVQHLSSSQLHLPGLPRPRLFPLGTGPGSVFPNLNL